MKNAVLAAISVVSLAFGTVNGADRNSTDSDVRIVSGQTSLFSIPIAYPNSNGEEPVIDQVATEEVIDWIMDLTGAPFEEVEEDLTRFLTEKDLWNKQVDTNAVYPEPLPRTELDTATVDEALSLFDELVLLLAEHYGLSLDQAELLLDVLLQHFSPEEIVDHLQGQFEFPIEWLIQLTIESL